MDIGDIVEEIKKLEQSESNWNNVQKLSWLYTVYDHMHKIPADIPPGDGSEFLRCANGKQGVSVMKIMDELMETTQVLNPRLYECVLKRLEEL